MNAFQFLFDWYNIPFVVALGCGILFIFLQLFGAIGDSDADAELDAELDADAGFFGSLAGTLGLGKVPLMLVLMAVLLTFGGVGLLLNMLQQVLFQDFAEWMFVATLLATMLLTVPLAGRVVSGLARLAPESSTAVGYGQLVGRMGVVVSPNVSGSYGRVQVRDDHGSIHTLFAISEQGDLIPEQTEVALIDYDNAKRHFIVRSMGRYAL